MTDCIDTIASLMPSSSGFKGSDVEKILDETIGKYFDGKEVEIEDLIDAPFLTEATRHYLDLLHGKLYGIERLPDEDDEDYRNRLIFQTKDKLTVNELKSIGCSVYAFVDDFDIDYQLTSRNTKLTQKLMVECPSEDIEKLVKDNLIWEKLVVFL